MKVLFIHDHFFKKYKNDYYSNGKLTYKQLSYYLNFGEKVQVISRFREVYNQVDKSYKSNGENINVLGLPGVLSKKGLLNRSFLISELEREINNADLIILRLPSEFGILAHKIALKKNKKILVEMVASPFDCLWHRGDLLGKLYAPILSFRTKKTLLDSENVIYVTSEFLQSKYPTNGNSVAISDARVKVVNKIRNINIDKRVRIGVIGNPALKLKGINTLFNAFSSLDAESYELSIVGGGLDSSLEKQMSGYKNIEQLGFISDRNKLCDWFSSIDIYIQPSLTEGLPRSILEAMSFGLPVIGSRVGGIPEIVDNSMLFSPKNYEQLLSKIKMLSDPFVYNNLSQYSLDVASRFDESLDKKKNNFIKNI
ncbi:glycosyltransferase [Photobacterium damselae]|uniref:glycosyltransferase n=1 Tax=Photobacterium damselae TaxID=38293 RepID=UPI003D7C8169